MLNRCSVNFLLKSVILVVSGALVIVFALGAWNAYGRYAEASRVEVLTGVSLMKSTTSPMRLVVPTRLCIVESV